MSRRADKEVISLSGKRITTNISWNLLGAIIPLFVAVITIPILIENLGTARFGLLTIIWVVVGYFSLFDLGLGRALTKLVSSNIGKGNKGENPILIWTALLFMGGLGLIGAIVLLGFSPMIVTDVLTIPKELQLESSSAFSLLSFSIPLVISSCGLIGVLEAHQYFKQINLVKMPLGILTFLGPTLVLPFSTSLVPITTVLLLTRLVTWFTYLYLVFDIVPELKDKAKISVKMARELFGFGSWMTVTNIIGPLMVYFDRFIIGAMLSMVAVAFYATPYEIVTKLWIISGALISVLFPAFSQLLEQDQNRAIHLSRQAVKYLFIIFFPITLVIVTFSHEVLTVWIDNDFADNSSVVLVLLALGVFINSHAQVPFVMLQGAGRPDITAKLHLIELPFYLLFLIWMLENYGIIGAAVAWVMRIILDSIVLFILTPRVLSIPSFITVKIIFFLGAVVVIFAAGIFLNDIHLKYTFTLLILAVFFYITWYYLLSENEKNMVRF